MVISDLKEHTKSGLARLEAKVSWEEASKSPFDLFVETHGQFEDAVWADPNAFLVACLLPAWKNQERRVKIEGVVCPTLFQNIRVALATLKTWYPELGEPPLIEPTEGYRSVRTVGAQAVSLLSCGIDSLAMLRWNRLWFPPNDPGLIKGVIFVTEQETPSVAVADFHKRVDERKIPVQLVAADAGVEAIPVISNMWWLVNDGYFYDYKWHGAYLTSIAALFGKRFQKAYIASSYDAAHLHAWGSHPLLDPYYGSSHFQVVHEGLWMSRFEKTSIVADWAVGLDNIRVCQNHGDGSANCGTCEKCIRTMTCLVALGKLRNCRSFPTNDVTPNLIATLEEYRMLRNEYDVTWYREIMPALNDQGRVDLVSALNRVLLSYDQTKCEGRSSDTSHEHRLNEVVSH